MDLLESRRFEQCKRMRLLSPTIFASRPGSRWSIATNLHRKAKTLNASRHEPRTPSKTSNKTPRLTCPETDTNEQIESFKDPEKIFEYRKSLESFGNGLFKRLVFNDTNQDTKLGFRKALEKFMSEHLHGDASLINRLQPSYQPWCRRLTPDDKYLEALQAPNAELVDTRIEAVTNDGIRQAGGILRHYDIIVVATGFANSRVPPWTMRGRHGILLSERWKDNVDGYISVCAPDMPNYFSIGCGPNFPIANGPVLSAMGFVADYILEWAVKISSENIKYVY
jgi:hypothetical protein